jgi:DeoR family transcriptional regulator of aga operon
MASKTARRQEAILEIVQRDGFTDIPALTRELGFSQATIRRDLAQLDRLGRLRRTYGGALAGTGPETPYREKMGEAAEAKQRIARAAAELVSAGMAVGFTGGTTTFYVARALARRSNLTVVTNALTVAMEFSGAETRVIVTGGELRGETFELIGPLAEPVLQHIHLDLMFVGVDGVSAGGGLTTYHPIEAQANRALMDRAARAVVVADGRKLGRRTFAQIAPIDRVQAVITDRDGPAAQAIAAAGVQVVIAD